MRQSGVETRVLGKAAVDLSHPTWAVAPIITGSNAVKDALNIRAVEDFAIRRGLQVEQYMGILPMVHGMPVIIGENYDVNGGIVNGSEGILKSVRYMVDKEGRRHATSAVVTVTKSSGQQLPNLPPYDVVVLQETISFTIKHPESGRAITFKRKQLPLLPAFALTDYKAQGKTLSRVIIDLQSCKRISSVYVMLSRATSLDGLLILRPFDHRKLRSHSSGDFRKEMRRLDVLNYKTILDSPSEWERHEFAQSELGRLRRDVQPATKDPLMLSDDDDDDDDDDDAEPIRPFRRTPIVVLDDETGNEGDEEP